MFDEGLTELFINRMDENQERLVKFMENDEFQYLVTEILRQEVYEEYRTTRRGIGPSVLG